MLTLQGAVPIPASVPQSVEYLSAVDTDLAERAVDLDGAMVGGKAILSTPDYAQLDPSVQHQDKLVSAH